MAARSHSLDDLLSRITSLFVIDVRMLQSGLVRNLLIVVVVSKPWGSPFEPNGVQRFHAGGYPAVNAHAFGKVAPQIRKLVAARDERCRPIAREFAAHDAAGYFAELDFFMGEEWHLREVFQAKLRKKCRSARPGNIERSCGCRDIFERDVIHDDEFF